MLIARCNSSTVKGPVWSSFFAMEVFTLLLKRNICAITRCNFRKDEYLVKNSSIVTVVRNEKDDVLVSDTSWRACRIGQFASSFLSHSGPCHQIVDLINCSGLAPRDMISAGLCSDLTCLQRLLSVVS